MAQPITEDPPHFDLQVALSRLLAGAAVVAGTVYMVALIATSVGREWPEPIVDASRGAFLALAFLAFFRRGFRRVDELAARLETLEAGGRYAEGYIDGVSGKPPAVPLERRMLQSVN